MTMSTYILETIPNSIIIPPGKYNSICEQNIFYHAFELFLCLDQHPHGISYQMMNHLEYAS